MKTYTLTENGKQILKTKSYAKLYHALEKILAGGTQFGIDLPTLHALGYRIETTVEA